MHMGDHETMFDLVMIDFDLVTFSCVQHLDSG